MERQTAIELAVDGAIILVFGLGLFGVAQPGSFRNASLTSDIVSSAQATTVTPQQQGGESSSARRLPPAESSSVKAENLLRVTADRLNLRTGPSPNAPRLAAYSKGSLVEKVTVRGRWVLVRSVEDDKRGWMYSAHLAEETAEAGAKVTEFHRQLPEQVRAVATK